MNSGDVKTLQRLRREGHSYVEIAKLAKRSSREVLKYTNKTIFSEEGGERYYNLTGVLKKIKTQKDLDSIKTRLIAHLLFDGTVYSSGFHKIARYINSSRELIDQFISDVEEVYGLKNAVMEIGKNNSFFKVSFVSKLMYEDLLLYFKSYSTSNDLIEIPPSVMNGSKENKLEFLRAFFEDEGSISFDGRLCGDLKSKKIIYQLGGLLAEFGLASKICTYSEPTGMMYKMYLPKRKEILEKFASLELFEKSRVSKGKNKGKFKQEVLLEAIKSFKNPK